jgi:hypothetical protein
MPGREHRRTRVVLTCLGAGALLSRCLVFDGKSASLLDQTDSGTADSRADAALPPDPGVRCGANEWCSDGAVCCLKLGSSGWFGPSTPCSAPGTCDNFAEFACDTSRECANDGGTSGTSCCATRESTATAFQGSSCVPLGACAPISLAVLLCTPTDRAPCPVHQSCVASDAGELPPGYYACQ